MWVEKGFSYRDLTPVEAAVAHNKQAFERMPLPYAEIPSVRFEISPDDRSYLNRERLLAYEAQLFADAECA